MAPLVLGPSGTLVELSFKRVQGPALITINLACVREPQSEATNSTPYNNGASICREQVKDSSADSTVTTVDEVLAHAHDGARDMSTEASFTSDEVHRTLQELAAVNNHAMPSQCSFQICRLIAPAQASPSRLRPRADTMLSQVSSTNSSPVGIGRLAAAGASEKRKCGERLESEVRASAAR